MILQNPSFFSHKKTLALSPQLCGPGPGILTQLSYLVRTQYTLLFPHEFGSLSETQQSTANQTRKTIPHQYFKKFSLSIKE
jgi:hypothetical protein